MKKYIILFLALSIAIAFSFSAFGASEEVLQEDAVAAIYTSVAQTMTAMPTPTFQPTTTAVPPTPTLIILPTATVISQGSSRGQGNQGQGQTASSAYTVSTIPNTGSLCNSAVYVNDLTVPDGTLFAPGETFEKTWTVLNAGTCNWEIGYALSFLSGEAMSGVAVPLSSLVAPNQQVAVTVQMTAPLTPGSYTGYWQMTDISGVKFGNAIFVQIVVSADEATSTAVPEITETLEAETESEPILETSEETSVLTEPPTEEVTVPEETELIE